MNFFVIGNYNESNWTNVYFRKLSDYMQKTHDFIEYNSVVANKVQSTTKTCTNEDPKYLYTNKSTKTPYL